MRKHKWILVVEDNGYDVDLTLRVLSAAVQRGRVVVARDGVEALDCLFRRRAFRTREDCPPALVLLDLKMPKVDGLDLLRQVRSDLGLKNIPIVVFSSSRERLDLVRSYELGANSYVVKPVQFQEFAATLNTVVEFWLRVNEPPPADGKPIRAWPEEVATAA